MSTVEELQNALKAAVAAEQERQRELRKVTRARYRFTLTLIGEDNWRRKELWDSDILLYELSGEVLNPEELIAAGMHVQNGGLAYLWNEANQRLIGPSGGGTTYLGWNVDLTEVVHELNAFLRVNPDGGDVTAIVRKHRAKWNLT